MAWCLENDFELVDMAPEEGEEDADVGNGVDAGSSGGGGAAAEMLMGSGSGVPRVIDALQAHMWPGLEMKSKGEKGKGKGKGKGTPQPQQQLHGPGGAAATTAGLGSASSSAPVPRGPPTAAEKAVAEMGPVIH